MSHITLVDVQVSNLAALEKAGTRVGLKLDMTAKKFRSYNTMTCDGKLYNPLNKAGFEIGLRLQANETYGMLVDHYMGGNGTTRMVESEPGAHDLGMLMKYYAEEVAVDELEQQGYMVERLTLDNGELELVATSYA